MGERTPLALLNYLRPLEWPVAEPSPTLRRRDVDLKSDSPLGELDGRCGEPGEDADYTPPCKQSARNLPGARYRIPVGKDSLSMQPCGAKTEDCTRLADRLRRFASGARCSPHADSALRTDCGAINGLCRSEQSTHAAGRLVPCTGVRSTRHRSPDCRGRQRAQSFFAALTELRKRNLALAYHDRWMAAFLSRSLKWRLPVIAGHVDLKYFFPGAYRPHPQPAAQDVQMERSARTRDRLPRGTGEEWTLPRSNEELGAVFQIRIGRCDASMTPCLRAWNRTTGKRHRQPSTTATCAHLGRRKVRSTNCAQICIALVGITSFRIAGAARQSGMRARAV